ncbi:MAG: hypothetical protein M0Z66_05765 [Thermaerobacter sp.]|nr:hypothetical protein [Thermaerobacter sp.]
MRFPYTKATAIAALTVILLAACGSQGTPKVRPSSPVAQQGRLIGSAVPLALASKTQASLFGKPPIHVVPTRLAMATRSVGWAAGKGLGEQAQSYLALGTSDGGSSFRVLFTAPAPIVAVAAPDARHAFFLEQQCANGGYCTSLLQEWRSGDRAPQTLWRGNADGAIALAFPTAQAGYFAVADMTSSDDTVHLFATLDGGKTFVERPQPCGSWNPSAPGAIYFSDPSTGWLLCGGEVGGADGTQQAKSLYATRDGGRNWSLIASTSAHSGGSLPTLGFSDALFFASSQVGYVGLDGNGIYGTADGGRTWRKVFASADPPGNWALSIGFLSGGFGWFLGGRGPALQETDNGGSTWRDVGSATPPVPDGTGWDLGGGLAISLARPSVYRWSQGRAQLVLSSDGGGTWTKLTDLALPGYAAALSATSPYDLTVGENLMKTAFIANSSDLGRTWSRIRLPKGWQVWALGYWRRADGWVVADYQNTRFGVFSCGQRICTRVPTPFSPLWAQMTDPLSGFAAGKDASGRWALFTTQDGGRHWTERTLPEDFNMGGSGAKGRLAWLYQVDDYPAEPNPPPPLYGGTIALVSSDGGRTWREIVLPAGLQAVVSLSFANASDGLLVTSSPVTGTSCWSTSDGGRTFHLLP